LSKKKIIKKESPLGRDNRIYFEFENSDYYLFVDNSERLKLCCIDDELVIKPVGANSVVITSE